MASKIWCLPTNLYWARFASEQVMEALGKMQFPNIYPDPESRRLRAALAEDSGLGAEHILVGCGADELIDLIMRYHILSFSPPSPRFKSQKPMIMISEPCGNSALRADVPWTLGTPYWIFLPPSPCMRLTQRSMEPTSSKVSAKIRTGFSKLLYYCHFQLKSFFEHCLAGTLMVCYRV